MAARFLVQVSDHPEALSKPAPAAAVQSWMTVYDAKASTEKVRELIAELNARGHRHVRAFRGMKLWAEH